MEKLKKFWKKNERVILVGSSFALLGYSIGLTVRYRKDIPVAQLIDTIKYKPFEDGTLRIRCQIP